MKCRSCRKRLYDYRDGTLSARDIASLEAHLADCPFCRAFFEREAALGRFLTESVERRRLTFRPDTHPGREVSLFSGGPIRLKPRFRLARLIVPLAVGGAGLILAIGFWLFDREPAEALFVRNSAGILEPADDLPDPLGDWIETRMIITIEDPGKGAAESYESTKSGGLRPVRLGRSPR
jgi:hypothetical protein